MSKTDLDSFDLKILDQLQTNGRMSNFELSETIGLSPSPCLRRLRHLEERGIISGYVALVNPAKVGHRVSAFVRVRLDQQDDRHLAAFESAVATFPEVMECYLMTGDCDYQIRLLTESLETFEEFLRSKLTKIPGVAGVTTSFALRPVVYNTRVPIGLPEA